jgi:2-dehydropantoate 2-reductase
METERILVIGPGAVGIVLAARLSAAGHEVSLGARTAAAAARVAKHGILRLAPNGVPHAARLPAYAPRSKLPRFDMALFTPRCQDAVPAANQWAMALPGEGPIIAAQNGIMGDALAPILGSRHLEATVSFPATLTGPYTSQQTGPGGLHVGPWAAGPLSADVRRVATALNRGIPTEGSSNMRGVKWTKLLANSCITTLGAVTGLSLGELLQQRAARDRFLAIIHEGYATGTAAGVRFERVAGFHPSLFSRGPGWLAPARRALVGVVARRFRRHRSSSLQALQRGGQTEATYLNGAIVRTALEHGVATPVNAALLWLAEEVEAGRAPSPDLLRLIPGP